MGKWRVTIVQRCKIICDMSYNTHGRITHEYKGENHLATFEIRATLLRVSTTLCNVVRLFMRPSATIWIANCCLWIQRRLDRTILSYKTNAIHVQRKRHDVRIAKFDIAKCFKVVGSQLWQGLKRVIILLRYYIKSSGAAIWKYLSASKYFNIF